MHKLIIQLSFTNASNVYSYDTKQIKVTRENIKRITKLEGLNCLNEISNLVSFWPLIYYFLYLYIAFNLI